MYASFQIFPNCIGPDAQPPNCPAVAERSGAVDLRAPATGRCAAVLGAPPASPAMPTAPPFESYCYCYWTAGNGFDGFASATALFSLAYAVMIGVAACANVRNKPMTGSSAVVSPQEPSVEPLQAYDGAA